MEPLSSTPAKRLNPMSKEGINDWRSVLTSAERKRLYSAELAIEHGKAVTANGRKLKRTLMDRALKRIRRGVDKANVSA